MHRPIVALFACLLLTATGLGLVGVATTVTQAPLAFAPNTATAAAESVDRFYAAADEALRTGDPTALRDAVAPGYVDHASATASRTGVARYVESLAELREACPDCRLAVEKLVVGTDRAAVRVAAHGHRQGTAAGVSGDGAPIAWTALDVLRVAGGRVAERWSRGDAPFLTDPLFEEVPVELPAGPAVLQVSRLILRAGAGLPPLTAAGPTVLAVEAGALSVRTDGTTWVAQGLDQHLDAVRVDAVLRQGERLVLTLGVRHTVRNDGPTPAVVLVVAIEPVAVLPEPDREMIPF
jgi:predicted ester cyclase